MARSRKKAKNISKKNIDKFLIAMITIVGIVAIVGIMILVINQIEKPKDFAGMATSPYVFVCDIGQHKGDVNGDGAITPTDAQMVFSAFQGDISIPTPELICCADVNDDCSVTPGDAQEIFNLFLSGNTNTPTCGESTCANGLRDYDEEGVDCGGRCPDCEYGSYDLNNFLDASREEYSLIVYGDGADLNEATWIRFLINSQIKRDYEIDPTAEPSHNLFLVGAKANNDITDHFYKCRNAMPGQAIVEMFPIGNGKYAYVIMGYNNDMTDRAVNLLVNNRNMFEAGWRAATVNLYDGRVVVNERR